MTVTGSVGQVWTLKSLLQASSDYLKEKGLPTARLDTEILLCKVFDCPRIELYINADKPVSTDERSRFRELVRRRASGEPVAYITGSKDFFGRTFKVNRHVLIPRPDSELILESVLAEDLLGDGRSILDVGTGSGCLAISIAMQVSNQNVTAWDNSPEALEVARSNAELFGCRVEWQLKDALLEESWQNTKKFDVIVSNPPYIAAVEKFKMDHQVVNFEPHQALFAVDDGLAFYRCFAKIAQQSLMPQGRLIMEVGWKQAELVSGIFLAAGWRDIKVYRDLQKIDRVLSVSPPLATES